MIDNRRILTTVHPVMGTFSTTPRQTLPIISTIACFALSSCVIEVPSDSGQSSYQTSASNQGAPPNLRTKPNGNIEVVFASGCNVLFDGNGKLIRGGQSCDDVDLHRAKQAVRAHLAEKRSNFNDV